MWGKVKTKRHPTACNLEKNVKKKNEKQQCQTFKNGKLVPSCGYEEVKIKILSHLFQYIKESLPKPGPP